MKDETQVGVICAVALAGLFWTTKELEKGRNALALLIFGFFAVLTLVLIIASERVSAEKESKTAIRGQLHDYYRRNESDFDDWRA
ncbi:MAG: hypothetical protein IJ737_06945 [Ruminococcus sp.]|nr:hypothetical protein [Ruminococcus sp.]